MATAAIGTSRVGDIPRYSSFPTPRSGRSRVLPPAPGRWESLVIVVRLGGGGEFVVNQRWVTAADLRPAVMGPNRAFGSR